MNKLKSTDHGGMPFSLDDLRWMDTAYRDGFKAIVKGMIGDALGAKVFGCIVVDTEQGDVVTCTEGWVFFNNEIYYVQAHNVVHSSGWLYFIEDITYDPLGDEIFEDSEAHGTYEIRRAILASSSSQPAIGLSYNADTLANLSGEQMNLRNSWQLFGLYGLTVSMDNGLSNITGAISYKNLGKTMICVVNLQCDVAGTHPVGTAIKIMIPDSKQAKTDQVVATSILISQSSNGLKFNIMRAVGGYIEIIDVAGIGILSGTGYTFKGELTFELQ